ncbi:MAG TPA: hypothetical protein VFU47_02745 [Armatimonadota bacterium]|nr:hypothetical protein [Armatimonadota bacterium]
MGLKDWLSRKSEAPPIDELLDMSDRELRKVIASGRVPQKSPKELRKAAQEVRRKTEGERGLGALRAGLSGNQGSGGKNYQNIPLRDRVHPAEYRRILHREAKRQGLL